MTDIIPWTTMFNLDTSIHIVGHVLVADCVEYFPDWWHFWYATSLIVPVFMRFQLSWLYPSVCQVSSTIMETLIYCISSAFMEIMILCIIFIMEILIYLYCTWRWPHMSYCIMLIHGHCTLMYLGLLYVFAVMGRVVSLYSADWMAGSSTGFFITSLLGWTYNVFRPSYDPSDLTH